MKENIVGREAEIEKLESYISSRRSEFIAIYGRRRVGKTFLQLAGLPESAVEAAAETAGEKGVEGWVFTLQAPSYGPFLTYADSRDLRRELYMAHNTKCTHDNASNNLEIVKKLANVRMEIAQLLGYDNFAEYNLQERMAQNSESVYKLLDQLLEAYTPTAKQEYAEVQALARQAEGEDFVLMPWDWAYYSHKLKDRKFNIDDELLRPYFELNNVKQGVFGLATRLYGITFKKNPDIPVYHKDVDAYEVFDKDGKFLAVFYTDFHPRAGKRSGAWMTSYKEQWIDEKTGENSRPHISIVMNFTKPTQDKPALLTFGEVETFLHEFGHSLHGMFANSTYGSLSGTNVYWDFVELPSQFMENFAIEKEFLHTFARHYQTGELIPDELVQRIVDSSNFNAAYACLRQVSFGLLDMAWYTRNTPFEGDVKAYEKKAWEKAQILPSVAETCMSTQFSQSCVIIVTIPVSCGRGETSLNMTSSPLMNNSTPKIPRPPKASVILPAISRAFALAARLMACGCQDSR